MLGAKTDMTQDGNDTFYLHWRNAMTALLVALFVPILYLPLAHGVYEQTVLALFNLTVAIVGIWFFSAVSISNDGLVLYRVNRLRWEDVKSARRVRFLGLPYMLIKRHKGFTWWLPLYYEGKRNIRETLRSVVPNGNPLRESINKV